MIVSSVLLMHLLRRKKFVPDSLLRSVLTEHGLGCVLIKWHIRKLCSDKELREVSRLWVPLTFNLRIFWLLPQKWTLPNNPVNVILVLVRLLKHLTRMKILWRDYLKRRAQVKTLHSACLLWTFICFVMSRIGSFGNGIDYI